MAPRVHPETDLEKKLMCMGAMYLEENRILDALSELLGEDLDEPENLDEDIRAQVLDEINDYFLRLDMNFSEEVRGDCIHILEEMWLVFDKKSALKNLEDIRVQGHRTKFNILKACVPSEGEMSSAALEKFKQIFLFDFAQEVQLGDEDYRQLGMWIQRTDKYLGNRGILAWDAGRYVQLVRLCFVAGYLNDHEAWAELLKFAPLIEGQYNSWLEYSQSFLIGRTFWSGQESKEAKEICQRLIAHPASPWLFYHWS